MIRIVSFELWPVFDPRFDLLKKKVTKSYHGPEAERFDLFWFYFNPRPERGGGADFAVPSCFPEISQKPTARFLRAFQYLPKNERRIF